jgi:hypothetical protein
MDDVDDTLEKNIAQGVDNCEVFRTLKGRDDDDREMKKKNHF